MQWIGYDPNTRYVMYRIDYAYIHVDDSRGKHMITLDT